MRVGYGVCRIHCFHPLCGLVFEPKGADLDTGPLRHAKPLDINADEAPTEALNGLITYVISTSCGADTRITLYNAAVFFFFPLCCPDGLCEAVLVRIFCSWQK